MPPSPPSCPQSAAIVAGHGRACILTDDGELLTGSPAEVTRLLGDAMPLLVHAPVTLRRLNLRPRPVFDLLELWAFVRPACAAAPTPRGLALAMDLPPPADMEDAAALLPSLVQILLARLAAGRDTPANADAAGLAARLGASGWAWAPAVLAALGGQAAIGKPSDGLRVWKRLPEWEEEAPLPPPSSHPVLPADARRRLASILGPGAEQRPGQGDYASAATAAFAPRHTRGDPATVLAEAGTGTGKTLGYVAPASLWAERNGAPVWISTFTRHLQRQVETELARLHPDTAERRRRVVVRKGRENYLCLLNFEDRVNGLAGAPGSASVIALGLLARWALATADGDIAGGDLPGWFGELFGPAAIYGLADRRGECIHGACPHYKRCYVEHTIRRARTAELVVANHALVMIQAAHGFVDGAEAGGLDGAAVPTRYVFDEGHHLFDAADSAFASVFCGIEGAELRRWLLGAEGGPSRARGLRRRLDELVGGRPELEAPLDAALQAARALPAPGWSIRLSEEAAQFGGHGAEQPADLVRTDQVGTDLVANVSEALLHLVRHQVLARVTGAELAATERRRAHAGVRPASPGARPGGSGCPAGARSGPHRRAVAHAGQPPDRTARHRSRRVGLRHPRPHRGGGARHQAPRHRAGERLAGDAAGGCRAAQRAG